MFASATPGTGVTQFTVSGPFRIRMKAHGRGYCLVYSKYWDSTAELKGLGRKKGVYVFGIQAGRGFTPVYVGLATKAFKQECFNQDNRKKYRDGIQRYKRCTPVLLLVVHPKRRGRYNKKAIDEIETFLIQLCADKNGNLQNMRKRKSPQWSIRGIIRGRQGRPTTPESCLRSMIGLKR